MYICEKPTVSVRKKFHEIALGKKPLKRTDHVVIDASYLHMRIPYILKIEIMCIRTSA